MKNEIVMPSGAKLKITLAPFVDARNLYQAVAKETKAVQITKLDQSAEVDANVLNMLKEIICSSLYSKEIEAALELCMKRCMYDGKQIKSVEDTFEPESARDDYLMVCFEVAKANILPFMKTLVQKYSSIFQEIQKSLVQG